MLPAADRLFSDISSPDFNRQDTSPGHIVAGTTSHQTIGRETFLYRHTSLLRPPGLVKHLGGTKKAWSERPPVVNQEAKFQLRLWPPNPRIL